MKFFKLHGIVPHGRRLGRKLSSVALASLLCISSQVAVATSDPFTSLLVTPGGAGIGFETEVENSPYRGGGTRHDFIPVYLYEGEYAYLHAKK